MIRICILSILLLAQPALCDTPQSISIGFYGFDLAISGGYRLHSGRLSPIPIYTADPSDRDFIPKEWYLSQRLRIFPSLTFSPNKGVVKRVSLRVETDLLDGNLVTGDGRDVLRYSRNARLSQRPFGIENVSLNAFYLETVIPPLILKIGRQRSDLGLGLVSNKGESDVPIFGVQGRGDVVDRGIATLLLGKFLGANYPPDFLTFSFGMDRVVYDLFANLSEKDRSYQLLSGASLKPSWGKISANYIYRWQKDQADEMTKIHVADCYLLLAHKVANFTLELESETAILFGKTDVPRSLSNPKGVKVRSYGHATIISLKHLYFSLHLEIGYASGDENIFDGTYKTFLMNPEHRVGLIMFHEFLKAQTAISAWNMADPLFSLRPARGYKLVATHGGVSNAIYLFPRVFIQAFSNTGITVGMVKASADTLVIDPFLTSVGGGKKINHLGGNSSYNIGIEFDSGVRTRWKLGPVGFTGGIDYGVFFPGDAFSYQTGGKPDPIHTIQFLGLISW